VTRLDLQPSGTPLSERVAHRAQSEPHLGEVIGGAASGLLRSADQDAVALEQLQPLGEKRRWDARCPLPDLVEGTATVEQVAHDDRRPAFCQQL
jgi:hypothetical protein